MTLLATGMVGGWWATTSYLAARTAPEAKPAETIAVPAFEAAAGAVMPDLRGLDESTSREILADAGISPESITVESKPAAGAAGLVIEQHPGFGTSSPAAVKLVLSAPAAVPNLVGQPLEKARQDLGILAAEVEVQQAYAAGVPAGQVLSVSPAAGEPLPRTVTVQVAEAPSSIFLSTLKTVEGSCSTSEVNLNGNPYKNSVSCGADNSGRQSVWLVNRVADSLETTVGIDDTDDPGTTIELTVLADGVPVAATTVSYGQTAPLAAPITGALRLEIVARTVSTQSGYSSASVVLGDARVIGGIEALKKIDG